MVVRRWEGAAKGEHYLTSIGFCLFPVLNLLQIIDFLEDGVFK